MKVFRKWSRASCRKSLSGKLSPVSSQIFSGAGIFCLTFFTNSLVCPPQSTHEFSFSRNFPSTFRTYCFRNNFQHTFKTGSKHFQRMLWNLFFQSIFPTTFLSTSHNTCQSCFIQLFRTIFRTRSITAFS